MRSGHDVVHVGEKTPIGFDRNGLDAAAGAVQRQSVNARQQSPLAPFDDGRAVHDRGRLGVAALKNEPFAFQSRKADVHAGQRKSQRVGDGARGHGSRHFHAAANERGDGVWLVVGFVQLGRQEDRRRRLRVGERRFHETPSFGRDPQRGARRTARFDGAALRRQFLEERNPAGRFRGRPRALGEKRVVQFFRVAHERRGFFANALDRFGVEEAAPSRAFRWAPGASAAP